MFKKKYNQKTNQPKIQKKRILITTVLLVFSLGLTLYFRFVFGIGIIYTHFFYIPIMVVSIWWGYWGMLVAAGLGIMLLVFNIYTGFHNYTEDFFRSFLFIIVAYLTGVVSNSEKKISYKFIETEKISKMRESIISLLTHQILTPLTSIKWQLELLIKNKTNNITRELKESLIQISDMTKRAIDLVVSFLHLNRIESGRVKYSPVSTDLVVLIDNVILEMEDAKKKKQQKIYFKKDNLAKVNIDPVIISQIIQNLLSNAIKYTPNGGVIRIIVESTDKEIFFEISDNGYGIPKNEHKEVFNKFFRGSNIVQNVSKGNGLGLSIVKSLVEFCGGKIWFESEKDKGTIFHFTLPNQK